jgi:hypothetical protein
MRQISLEIVKEMNSVAVSIGLTIYMVRGNHFRNPFSSGALAMNLHRGILVVALTCLPTVAVYAQYPYPQPPQIAHGQSFAVNGLGVSGAMSQAMSQGNMASAFGNAFHQSPHGFSNASSSAFSNGHFSHAFSNSMTSGPNGMNGSFSGSVTIGGQSHSFSHAFNSPKFTAPNVYRRAYYR